MQQSLDGPCHESRHLLYEQALIVYICIYEPPRDKTNEMICAPSEDSDQPGYPPSLIRVFAVRSVGVGVGCEGGGVAKDPSFLYVDSED